LIFFCALSAITPPVGVAAYTAAGIANANPLKIGIQATKLASVGFIIPFMFVYQPSLLMQGNLVDIVLSAVTAIIGVYALAAAMEGYLKNHLAMWERLTLFFAAIAMIYPSLLVSAIALVIIVTLFFKNKREAVESNKKSVVPEVSEIG
jgi:TRAP-type uncharacterized transport system fused permease subunit